MTDTVGIAHKETAVKGKLGHSSHGMNGGTGGNSGMNTSCSSVQKDHQPTSQVQPQDVFCLAQTAL